jgi:crotonobetainyl-CoA:carnitine CoA-transferase CaiB-like acyl-CoA transferase
MKPEKSRAPILSGLRVLDVGHQVAAATCGAILADLGADVVLVEHPTGGPLRNMLPKKNGQSMWWKVTERGKTQITLNLSSSAGRVLFLDIAKDFDVLIENFRPGTLEKWGLGPDDLEKAGLNLTMVRISGFGQTGPYSPQPGYGSVAEAMSGFANMNGFPDGPPTFPSSTLADGVAALWGVIGALSGLYGSRGTKSGVEVVDVALVEGLFRLIPTQIVCYDQTSQILTRPGNFTGRNGSLRNCYRTSDERWFIVAGTGDTIRPILVGAGATDLVAILNTGLLKGEDIKAIATFLVQCDKYLAEWSAAHDYDYVAAALRQADAVFGPVYDAADIMNDPHFEARDQLVTLPDADLGEITMQGIVPKFPARDHQIRHPGRAKGWDNEEFYASRGIAPDELVAMRKERLV